MADIKRSIRCWLTPDEIVLIKDIRASQRSVGGVRGNQLVIFVIAVTNERLFWRQASDLKTSGMEGEDVV